MSKISNQLTNATWTGSVNADLEAQKLCPFCGALNTGFDSSRPCGQCLIADTAATRSATRARLGPWYVLQSRNPGAPGMSFATIVGMIRRGQVKPRGIVRGPTSHQLWQFASTVRGLSREFGVCFDCGKSIDKTAHYCPHCNKIQEPSANPDAFLETIDLVRQPIQQSDLPEPATLKGSSNRPSGSSAPAPKQPVTAPSTRPTKQPIPPNKMPTATAVPSSTTSDPYDDDLGDGALLGQDVLGAKGLATAFHLELKLDPNTNRKRLRRQRLMRGLVLFVLLGMIGFAGYCWANPKFGSDVGIWLTRQWNQLHQTVNGWIKTNHGPAQSLYLS